jgi:hypothetical protein
VLEERLRRRSKDSEAQIHRRRSPPWSSTSTSSSTTTWTAASRGCGRSSKPSA